MERLRRVLGWVRRYLVAELAGVAGAFAAAVLAGPWSEDRLAIVAYAASIGETIGFYAGFLITRYLREEIDGPRRKRVAVIVAAAVVEFGPADLADTFLVRPGAMYLGSLLTGNVLAGVIIGKVAADLVFYGMAITSYEVVIRRFLRRFRPETTEPLAGSNQLAAALNCDEDPSTRATPTVPAGAAARPAADAG